ncbi:hypothetical protein JEP40_00480 [Proteus vulgaris]|uniref:hypothetical protein n=1 Tax=Proteus vulgaris TaxID=585 RepID=UPI0018E46C83|nr:hypothetical protein [Proteus vulgaris]MBI6527600.1 hypothetical protein [Proteus vulgaris]
MDLNQWFCSYLEHKYKNKALHLNSNDFEYSIDDDNNAELFFKKNKDNTVIGWDAELQPSDPGYSDNEGKQVSLEKYQNKITIYDEQNFYYLIITINSMGYVRKLNFYNRMNDFIKEYCFFQLSRLNNIKMLNDRQINQLHQFLFKFFLYCHPVNYDTLTSFSVINGCVTHISSKVKVSEYIEDYYHNFLVHYSSVINKVDINAEEIQAIKALSLQLLKTLEGKGLSIIYPENDHSTWLLHQLNHIDDFLYAYHHNNTYFFEQLSQALDVLGNRDYDKYCLSTFLQNYVMYILFFDFDEIDKLTDFFIKHKMKSKLSRIINKMFSDTIFLQKIIREKNIQLTRKKEILNLMKVKTRKIYSLS